MTDQRTIVIIEGDVTEKLPNELRRFDTFDGGFNLQYVSNESQNMHLLRNMMNARIDDKNVIKNHAYQPIVEELKAMYPEYLSHINPTRILFVEDENWEQTEKTNPNSRWKIEIKKAPKALRDYIGYEYVVSTRTFFIEKWNTAQIHAAVFEKLLRIHPDNGSVLKYGPQDKGLLVATLGAKFLDDHCNIPNVLESKMELKELREANGQQTMFQKVDDTE